MLAKFIPEVEEIILLSFPLTWLVLAALDNHKKWYFACYFVICFMANCPSYLLFFSRFFPKENHHLHSYTYNSWPWVRHLALISCPLMIRTIFMSKWPVKNLPDVCHTIDTDGEALEDIAVMRKIYPNIVCNTRFKCNWDLLLISLGCNSEGKKWKNCF